MKIDKHCDHIVTAASPWRRNATVGPCVSIDMTLWRALCAGALLLVLASCADGTHKPAGAAQRTRTASPPQTITRTFHAYDASGGLTMAVTAQRSGSCWTTSIAAPGPDAYRCFAGNTILDPCFAPPRTTRPRSVACVVAPWSSATVLTLTKRLPARDPLGGAARPWALELGNGARCVVGTGTVAQVGGVDLPYLCKDGGAALRQRDTVAEYALLTARSLRRVPVRTVWRTS